MARLVLLRKQRAVGHGFFHEAVLKYAVGSFRWVYDCGGGRAKREVREYGQETGIEPVDILFLSHLHADHVSGLPTLLASKKIRRAFLPYLTPTERLLVFLRSLADGSVRPWFPGFLADPAGWLQTRGVQEVVEVVHSEEPPPPPDEVGPSNDPDRRRDQGENAVRVVVVERGTHVPSGTQTVTDRARVLATHEALTLTFLLYVKPAEVGAAEKLLSLAGSPHGVTLSEMLRNETGLRALRQAYHAVWRDLNWTSLCVACIPSFSSRVDVRFVRGWIEARRWYHKSWFGDEGLGWLGLGDAVLKKASEVDLLRTHFGQALREVGLYSIPHHGSAENFCPALLDLGTTPAAFKYATARSNSKKHPAPSVRRAFEEHGVPLEVVTEDPETALAQFIVFDDVALSPGSSAMAYGRKVEV